MTLRGIGRGLPVTEILGLVGLQMQTDIQTAIMQFNDPPNAASTVAKKGVQAPLRESLLLYDSIKSEVVEEWNLIEMEANSLHEVDIEACLQSYISALLLYNQTLFKLVI